MTLRNSKPARGGERWNERAQCHLSRGRKEERREEEKAIHRKYEIRWPQGKDLTGCGKITTCWRHEGKYCLGMVVWGGMCPPQAPGFEHLVSS